MRRAGPGVAASARPRRESCGCLVRVRHRGDAWCGRSSGNSSATKVPDPRRVSRYPSAISCSYASSVVVARRASPPQVLVRTEAASRAPARDRESRSGPQHKPVAAALPLPVRRSEPAARQVSWEGGYLVPEPFVGPDDTTRSGRPYREQVVASCFGELVIHTSVSSQNNRDMDLRAAAARSRNCRR